MVSRPITLGHIKPPSTVYQMTGNVWVIVPASHGCGQLGEISKLRTSTCLQPGILHRRFCWRRVEKTAILQEERVTRRWRWEPRDRQNRRTMLGIINKPHLKATCNIRTNFKMKTPSNLHWNEVNSPSVFTTSALTAWSGRSSLGGATVTQ